MITKDTPLICESTLKVLEKDFINHNLAFLPLSGVICYCHLLMNSASFISKSNRKPICSSFHASHHRITTEMQPQNDVGPLLHQQSPITFSKSRDIPLVQSNLINPASKSPQLPIPTTSLTIQILSLHHAPSSSSSTSKAPTQRLQSSTSFGQHLPIALSASSPRKSTCPLNRLFNVLSTAKLG